MVLPAIDAETEHVPVPEVTETRPDELTVHAVDDPCDHVTFPADEPPDTESWTVPPYDADAEPDTESAAWVALIASMFVLAEVA